MKLVTVSQFEIDRYHTEIPMIKEGTTKIVISNSIFKEVKTTAFSIDMRLDEKTSLWKEILNFNKTLIQVFEVDGQFIAGAITVTNSPSVNMLKGDMSNAVLWDIRVHPDYQNSGLASILMKYSIEYSKEQNCKSLLIETQDNNPKAISFYLKHGASISEVNIDAYPKELNETQFIFKIQL